MNRMNRIFASLAFLAALFLVVSCGTKEYSHSTGWAYNDPENGGFEVSSTRSQITGPGLVFIEGGTFVMGATQEDLMFNWDNFPRRVTIPSFYMDETEVSNLDYLEYLYWIQRVFGLDYPEVYRDALPDTLVWRDELAYNEPLVRMYFRHPAYHDYPVVGVTWVQANKYADWRTDRVNEMLLIEEGILDWDPNQINESNFTTEAYLAGQYEGAVLEQKQNLNPTAAEDTRRVRLQDGILLPNYRLPTEAEWEYAALGLIGNTLYERIVERRTYPWNGDIMRTDDNKYYGSFIANFKRGDGDYMGVAGNLNDGADIPAPVGSYWPNDYGLYNMSGNVSEWVLDVYRPLSYYDFSDYSPFRGNVFKKKMVDFEGFMVEKDSLGRIRYEEVTTEENLTRRNYRKADNINYGDGDINSQIRNEWLGQQDQEATDEMYEYGATSLISDKARVYKGGSWKDMAYWLSPGTRRFLDENEASSTIGFRCAMSRVGSPLPGNN